MKAATMLTVVACCISALACAQGAPAAGPACRAAADTSQADLLGLWRATFDGLPQGATLLLEKHPELKESVRGAINRNGEKAAVAGDVDEGEFTLEESLDGVRISATWAGDVVEGSCGKEIRGDWQGAKDAKPRAFVLRKLP